MVRPVRIANCSGALTDPGVHMFDQARCGQVDFITGDYLAEANMADAADNDASLPKWIPSAMEGLKLSLDIINEKRIKVIVNGGGLDPQGMAEKVHEMITEKKLNLRVAYTTGDNLMHKVHSLLESSQRLPHLDGDNANITLEPNSLDFLSRSEQMPIVSANAYLGYRAIKAALDAGADIIICGRVADASPVIAAAAWWHGWYENEFDKLAGALVAGHLIECSSYVTGANFAGADEYAVEEFVNLGLPIAEIDNRGECVITKHEQLGGFVTVDTVKCQFLYELQGNMYLNSDVKAYLSAVTIHQESRNRVRLSGIKGLPPPPTTKLAIFYRGGYQLEILLNASGYATSHKWDIQEAQIRNRLGKWNVLEKLDVLDFQRVGVPMENPGSQLQSTTYMRVFAQAKDPGVVAMVPKAWLHDFIRPKPFFGYYPAIVPQAEVEEVAHTIDLYDVTKARHQSISPPRVTEPLALRKSYDTESPATLSSFGPSQLRPLGDIALGRSGDKGGNVNLGLFVQSSQQWEWFRSFMSRDKLQELMGEDWRSWYYIERVEFPGIFAVHFVVYGPLGRGISSTKLLDGLGKGFAEFIRAVWVPVPTELMEKAKL